MSLQRSREIHPNIRESELHELGVDYERRVQSMLTAFMIQNPGITPILEQLNGIGELQHGMNVAVVAEQASMQMSLMFDQKPGGDYASFIFLEGAKRAWTSILHDIGKIAVSLDVATSLVYMYPERYGLLEANGIHQDGVTLTPYLLARQRLHTSAGRHIIDLLHRYGVLHSNDSFALGDDAVRHHDRLDFQGHGRSPSFPDRRYHSFTKEDYVIEIMEKLADETVAMREVDRSYRSEQHAWPFVISHLEHFLGDRMIRKVFHILGFSLDRHDYESVAWLRSSLIHSVVHAVEHSEPLYGNVPMDNLDEYHPKSGDLFLQHLVTSVWQEHHRALKALEHAMHEQITQSD